MINHTLYLSELHRHPPERFRACLQTTYQFLRTNAFKYLNMYLGIIYFPNTASITIHAPPIQLNMVVHPFSSSVNVSSTGITRILSQTKNHTFFIAYSFLTSFAYTCNAVILPKHCSTICHSERYRVFLPLFSPLQSDVPVSLFLPLYERTNPCRTSDPASPAEYYPEVFQPSIYHT